MQLHHTKSVFLVFAGLILLSITPAHSAPWPAEPRSQAVNLTYAAPGNTGIGSNLSGAYWNDARHELWLVRNGGSGGGSKMWVLQEYFQPGTPTWHIKVDMNNVRGEWNRYTHNGQQFGFGDLEDITFVDDASNIAYLLIEGEERIKSVNVSNYGAISLVRDYNIRPHLPLSGGAGAEGIAFVPDSALQAIGFKADNAAGQAEVRTSRNGMGGLMFVGHQNGGSLYVFDLDPNSNSFDYVGKYDTLNGATGGETAALAFDRSTGEMYIWHDNSPNGTVIDKLEVTDLRSTRIGPKHYRLIQKRIFDSPTPGTDYNYEGIALRPIITCGRPGKREFFMTVDEDDNANGTNSLFWYRQFTDGCPSRAIGATTNTGPIGNGGIAGRPAGR